MIVEDAEDIRFLLQMILEEKKDYVLTFAENGPEALTKSIQLHPDLIFMDMSLPLMSGWDVVSQLRQHYNQTQLPIVALTAHASQADQAKAMAIGCNVYISKPFDMETVLEIAERLLKYRS